MVNISLRYHWLIYLLDNRFHWLINLLDTICQSVSPILTIKVALLLLCGDLELNPSPNYKYPCGICGTPVECNQKGIECDECEVWYHTCCIGLSGSTYQYLGCHEDMVFCFCCSLPQFLDSCFNDVDGDHVLMPSQVSDVSGHDKKDEGETCLSNFHLLHLNTWSLLPKIDDIRHLALVLCAGVSILILSETWLDSSVDDGEVAFDGYRVMRKDRNRYGGGVLAFVPTFRKAIRRQDLELDGVDSLWLELRPKTGRDILLAVAYHPPAPNIFHDIVMSIENSLMENKEVIIIGDLNCNMLTSNSLSGNLQQFLEEYGFSQLIMDPTRVTSDSQTLIDIIATTHPKNYEKSGIIPCGVCDHCIGIC